jgi:hypothetical protein
MSQFRKEGIRNSGADELLAANICATCMQPCARVHSVRGGTFESSPKPRVATHRNSIPKTHR